MLFYKFLYYRNLFGGNGNKANPGPAISDASGRRYGYCIDGPFASIRLVNSRTRLNGVTNGPDCIRRRFSTGTATLSSELINMIGREMDFSTYSQGLEIHYHSKIHVFVGGEMGDGKSSAGLL
jgi:hypothetical protein